MDTPRIGIIANTNKPGARDVVVRLTERFEQHEVPYEMEAATAKLAGIGEGRELKALVGDVDIILLLGGDGTILHLASALGRDVKPIAAINIGTLGFLTLTTTDDLDAVVDMLRFRKFEISYRSVLRVSVYRGEQLESTRYALNEVVFSRGNVSRVVRVQAKVDGEFLTRYSGDGMIIATPTGSTAYSLSAGGPVVEPRSRVFILTPVCNHSLSGRPLVVSDQSTIEITTPEQREEVFMTVDGQIVQPVNGDTRMVIQLADYQVPLIMEPHNSFFKLLRNKLEWKGGR